MKNRLSWPEWSGIVDKLFRENGIKATEEEKLPHYDAGSTPLAVLELFKRRQKYETVTYSDGT